MSAALPRRGLWLALLLAALAAPAAGPAAPVAAAAPAPGRPTVAELLNATDDLARGASSHGTLRMSVTNRTGTRTMAMEVWTRGTDESLVVIQEPAKDKGVATLKVGDNIWNYLPKVDRTVKVPASMMGGSWMGSHLTNDDLVKSSRMADDFTATLVEEPTAAGQGRWVIALTPKPEAAVVWGKVVVEIRADRQPERILYYDEGTAGQPGRLVRSLVFSEVRTQGGRTFPARMSVIPADAPAEKTELVYEQMQFDIPLPDSTFSLQSLRR